MPWNCTQGHGNADDANFCPKCGEGKPRPLTTADLEMVLQRLLQAQQGGQQAQQPAPQPQPTQPQRIAPRFPQRQQPEPEEEDEDYNPRQPQARRQQNQAAQPTQPPTQPLSITTQEDLPTGAEGMPYAYHLSASGGHTPYAWALTGRLPTGIIHTNGQLTGTATQAGNFAFVATVTDQTGSSATKPLTLVVNPATQPTPPAPTRQAADWSPRGVLKKVWDLGQIKGGGSHQH